MQLQITAKPSVLCCHLANTNEKLGGQRFRTTIPLFAKLRLSRDAVFAIIMYKPIKSTTSEESLVYENAIVVVVARCRRCCSKTAHSVRQSERWNSGRSRRQVNVRRVAWQPDSRHHVVQDGRETDQSRRRCQWQQRQRRAPVAKWRHDCWRGWIHVCGQQCWR